jgi:hypothetical protein
MVPKSLKVVLLVDISIHNYIPGNNKFQVTALSFDYVQTESSLPKRLKKKKKKRHEVCISSGEILIMMTPSAQGFISLSGTSLQWGHDKGVGPIKMSATEGTFART